MDPLHSPVDRIVQCAEISVRRAIAFASLGIGTATIGFFFQPTLALQVASVLCGLVAATCALKAVQAPRRPYRRTEVWVLLDGRLEIADEQRRQALIGRTLQKIYARYARWSAAGAASLLALSLVLPLIEPVIRMR